MRDTGVLLLLGDDTFFLALAAVVALAFLVCCALPFDFILAPAPDAACAGVSPLPRYWMPPSKPMTWNCIPLDPPVTAMPLTTGQYICL